MDFGGQSNEGFSARRSYGPPGGGSNISFGGPVPVGQSHVDKPTSSNPYAATYDKQHDPIQTGRSNGSPQSYRARQEPSNNGNFLQHQSQQQYQQPPQSYRDQGPPQQQYQGSAQQQYQQPPQSYRDQGPPQQYQQPPQSYRDQDPKPFEGPPQQFQQPKTSQFDIHSSDVKSGRGGVNTNGDHQPTGAGAKPALFMPTGREGEKPSGQVTRRDMVWEQKKQKFLEKQRSKKDQVPNGGGRPALYGGSNSQVPFQQDPDPDRHMSHSARLQSASPPSPLSMLVNSTAGSDTSHQTYQSQAPQGYQNQAPPQPYQQAPQSQRQGEGRPGSGRHANTGSVIAYGDSMGQSSGENTARRGRGAGGGSSQISFG